ncbi:MAG TPA: hypothetical protein VES01_04900 [Dermatophilaceae bacterium]|nr:hypothetical protein [Dermatophilaceae bacterium]
MAAPDQGLDLTAAIGRAILGEDGTDDPPLRPAEPGDHLKIVSRAAAAEQASRKLLQQAVGAARGSGHSWAAIGAELGLSRQGVQQRFGTRTQPEDGPQYRWLGPVTAFDEMPELELAGRLGWHTVEAGMLRHKMVRTDTQWEHKRVVWSGPLSRYEQNGWQVGCRAFPWAYLVRDLGAQAQPPASGSAPTQ